MVAPRVEGRRERKYAIDGFMVRYSQSRWGGEVGGTIDYNCRWHAFYIIENLAYIGLMPTDVHTTYYIAAEQTNQWINTTRNSPEVYGSNSDQRCFKIRMSG